MRRDYVIAGALWIAISTVGVLLVLPAVSFMPAPASEEGLIIDDAFRQLMFWGWPVFCFVVVVLVYSIVRFRARPEDGQDGPPIRTNTRVYTAWTLITTALAAVILVNPGIKGVLELRENRNADMVIEVTAEQWNWIYYFPEYDVTLEDPDELLLPVDTHIRFEVTSDDVIHSFWIPSFRMKVDAVPGRTTVMYVTPTGNAEDDFNMRVQCAEVCGTGHARMRTAEVTVVAPSEFTQWIEAQVQ
jgi:cytochrome c oxidase subunit 2